MTKNEKKIEQCEQKLKNVSNCVSNMKDKLFEIGIGYSWGDHDNFFFYKSYHLHKKRRIIDTFVQFIMVYANSSSRCTLCRNIIDRFFVQYYFVKPITCINKCPRYQQLRFKFIEKYYGEKP